MATYKDIQAWTKINYGFLPQTCWIAEVKEISGLIVHRAPNRKSDKRIKKCPSGKIEPIRNALKHFGILQN